MPKVPEGKVRLEVLIDKETYEMLIRLAPQLYGKRKYRGAISYVVDRALKAYLLPIAHTNAHTNPSLDIRRVYDQVKERLGQILNIPLRLVDEPIIVPEKILDQAIGETRGWDPRTIKKWKNLFFKTGLMKPVGGSPNNRSIELIR